MILHVHPIQLVTGMLARCFGCGHGPGLLQQTVGLHLSFPTYVDVDVATLAVAGIRVICSYTLPLQQDGAQTGVGIEFTQAGHHLVQLAIGLLHAHGLCRPLQQQCAGRMQLGRQGAYAVIDQCQQGLGGGQSVDLSPVGLGKVVEESRVNCFSPQARTQQSEESIADRMSLHNRLLPILQPAVRPYAER